MAANALRFTTQPSASFDSEVQLPQQPVVEAYDTGTGLVDTTFTGLVTLSVPLGNLVQRPGANAPVLNCVNGVASFTDINVSAGQACALVASATGLASATSSTMTPTAVGGRDDQAELPRVTPSKTYPSPITTTYTVGSGKTYATIQAAINAAVAANANTHSEIIIDPGTYTESLSFGKKTSGTGYIILRPVTMPCAAGTRALPSMFASGGVKLQAPSGSLNVGTVAGAHHFILAGLEIVGNYGTFIQFAVPAAQESLANCPDFLGIDRCYIHGTSLLASARAIEYGAKTCYIVDSYGAEVHQSGNGDTQIVGGWSGPGPLLIENNYLEAAGEITMLGGSDTTLVDVPMQDITIRRNHFRKPLGWKGVWSSKNQTELKTGRRVLYEYNIFENQWYDAQDTALTFGSAGQYGTAPWMGIRDLTFRFNELRNASRLIVLNRANMNTIGPITVGTGRGITTSGTGGTIPANTTYYYKITALFNTIGFSGVTPISADASGVTYSTVESSDMMDGDSGSNEVHATTGAGSTNSNAIVFRVTPGAIGFRIYRGTAAGAETQYVQIGVPAMDGNFNATWTDTGGLSWTAGTVPSGTPVKTVPIPMHRASVHDNVFVGNNKGQYLNAGHSAVVFIAGVDDLSFFHNTFPSEADTGLYLGGPAGKRCRFDFNIGSFRAYAISGDVGGANGQAMLATAFTKSVSHNVALDIDGSYGITQGYFGGSWGFGTTATVGFGDPTKLTDTGVRTASFPEILAAAALASGTYANTTWTGDGKMVGADISALTTGLSGVIVSGEGTLLSGDTADITPPPVFDPTKCTVTCS